MALQPQPECEQPKPQAVRQEEPVPFGRRPGVDKPNMSLPDT
jgi:hypothetical protein